MHSHLREEAGRTLRTRRQHYTASAYDELGVSAAEPSFRQMNYSLGGATPSGATWRSREAGIGVLVNRPFAEGALFRRVRGQALPAWAAEFDCASWAQFFLKWILAHPAVTCAIPATSRPEHLADNMTAGTGALPDAAAREKMASLLRG